MYIRLSHGEKEIDIRTDDVEAFIAEIKNENDPTALKGTKEMTLYDVRDLALYKDLLDWSHFADFKGRDVGSGQNVWEFELPKGFVLRVCGVTGEKPSLVELSRDGEKGIDIRKDDVSAYICSKEMTLDDVRELAKKGEELDWADFEDFKCHDASTCIRCWQFDLGDGFELEIGGSDGAKPDFILLSYYSFDTCDVRKEDVGAFIDYITAKYIYVKGDANFDRYVDMADVVFIMQCLANPNKYQFTEQGRINADMDGNGITVADAQTIQMMLLGYDVSDIISADRSAIAGKTFIYEKEGFGGGCNIKFNDDGTFLYSPGYLSSYMGGGTWKISGKKVILTQENDGMAGKRVNYFSIVGNALVFIEEGSDNLFGITVKNGEKFYLTAEEAENASEASKIISIKTNYNPAMSDWSGIGILLEVDSPDYPITLKAADGHFTEWDIKTGSGTVKTVGKEYDAGKNGSIFWTPDEFSYPDGFESVIQVIGTSGDASVELGKIYISQVNGMKFVASFEKPVSTDSSAVAGKKFVYEKEGFGGDCYIEFKEDGTFLYSPGYLSSYLGGGTWEISGNKVVLTQENDGMVGKRVNYFNIVGNELIFIEEGSDNFIGTNVKDGEKFCVKQSAATLLGIGKAKVTGAKVSSLPQGYDYSFTGDKAQAVFDYLSNLNLSNDLSGNPDEMLGMTWVIKLDYENGDTVTVYHFGNFIHGEEHKWYEMSYEESQGFSSLIWELGK